MPGPEVEECRAFPKRENIDMYQKLSVDMEYNLAQAANA